MLHVQCVRGIPFRQYNHEKEKTTMKKWVCSVCGYVHEGDEAPEICPLCGVDASQFEEVED